MSHLTFARVGRTLKGAGITAEDVAAALRAHAALGRLKRRLKARGITQADVAAAAGVGRTLVVHVFAGRATSKNVLDTAKRLLADGAGGREP